MANKLTLKEAAELSEAAYTGEAPGVWRQIDKEIAGPSSCTIYINDTRKTIVFAFKGTNSTKEALSDIVDNGGERYMALQEAVQQSYLEKLDDYPGYQIVTTGHSLGGGMAQTFALTNSLDGYGQNALPVSQFAIDRIWPGEDIEAKIAQYNSDHNFQEVNVRGDIATSFYYELRGLRYLDSEPVTLAHPVDEKLDAVKVLVLAKLVVEIVSLTGVVGTLLGYALSAHSLKSVLKMLDNEVAGGDDTSEVIKQTMDLVSLDSALIQENGDVELKIQDVKVNIAFDYLEKVEVENPSDGAGEIISFENSDGDKVVINAVYDNGKVVYYESVEAKAGGGIKITAYDADSFKELGTADYIDSENYTYKVNQETFRTSPPEKEWVLPKWLMLPNYVYMGTGDHTIVEKLWLGNLNSELIRNKEGFILREYNYEPDGYKLTSETQLDLNGTPTHFIAWELYGIVLVELKSGMSHADDTGNGDWFWRFYNKEKPYIAPVIADLSLEKDIAASGSPYDAGTSPGDVNGGGGIIISPIDLDDELIGDAKDNVLVGGRGNDILKGELGSDTYVFNLGDGQDTIIERGEKYGDLDVIRLGQFIDGADLVLSRRGSDLIFSIVETRDSITVRNWFSDERHTIERIKFSDRTTWEISDINARIASLDYVGGDADDILIGNEGANIFNGGKGNDTLHGSGGSDIYKFARGDGDDQINDYSFGGEDIDVIRFDAGISGSDVNFVRVGSDIVALIAGTDDSITVAGWGGSEEHGIERVEFADGTIWAGGLQEKIALLPYIGTDEQDFLEGNSANNLFIGGKGDDILAGWTGSDTYLFNRGDGRDSILDFAYDSVDMDGICFGPGILPSDISVIRVGDEITFAVKGTDDNVTVRNWNNSSNSRVEFVKFADGTIWDAKLLAEKIDVLPYVGTAGDDSLIGDDKANFFAGGKGDDRLQGKGGSDIYLFNRGDGKDVIFEHGYGDDNIDVIRFGTGVLASEVGVALSGGDLIFSISNSEDNISITNWSSETYYRIERVEFANGIIWDEAAIQAKISAMPYRGTPGDDVLRGDSNANTFQGGKGDDQLDGGQGSDVYLFERGDGKDIIDEFGFASGELDIVRFGSGIAAADVAVSRAGENLIFSIAGTNDSVTIKNWGGGNYYRIERVEFADGTFWTEAAIEAKVSALPYLGTVEDDVLRGDSGANIFQGGKGNDQLDGGQGGDVYLFERGDGKDIIDEFGFASGELDIVRFGSGIAAADVAVSRGGENLVFSIAGTNDSVTIKNWGGGNYYRIERVEFADGTFWNEAAIEAKVSALPYLGTVGDDVLRGDSGANIFQGGKGNDQLDGGQGGDVYLFERGDGKDMIDEFGFAIGELDIVRFGSGIAAADVAVSRAGENLVFSIAGTNDSVTIKNWGGGNYYRIERVEFADGTFWNDAAIEAKVSALPYLGTVGDDVLRGDSGANIFQGGKGNDQLDGGQGGDVYLFERGDGKDMINEFGFVSGELDIVRFGSGIAAADVVVSRAGENLVFSLAGTNDSVTIKNWGGGSYYRIERVEFADGTFWNEAAIEAKVAALPYFGTVGDDVLRGDSGANIFLGGKGNDQLDGGQGGDIYLFERGDGKDMIDEFGFASGELDIVRFGSGIAATDIVVSRDSDNLVFSISNTNDSVTVKNWGGGNYYRIERVEFSDGTIWNEAAIEAKISALPYLGTAGEDVLRGDSGANIFQGGKGNDQLDGGQGGDIYLFERGDGKDMIDEFGFASGELDIVRFGSGIAAADVIVSRDKDNLVFSIVGTDDSVTVKNWGGGNYYRIEQVEFNDGNIWSEATLAAKIAALPYVGTIGDDILRGDNAANIFQGGKGNDQLDGGQESDTYLFERGDGMDTVDEFGFVAGEVDKIRFGSGVSASDITIKRVGENLTMSIAGTDDSITVNRWYNDSYYKVELVEFDDGTIWDTSYLNQIQLIGIDPTTLI